MRIKTLLLAVVLLLAGASLPLQGQTPRVYEPLRRSPEYKEAFRLADRGARVEAIAIFLQIAAQNPGTTLGAEALFEVAYFCEDVAQARSAYQAIIAGWPRSRFEVEARYLLMGQDNLHLTDTQWVAATEALVTSLGGPSLQAMQRGNPQQLVRDFSRLPLETRIGLITPYSGLRSVLIHQLSRYDEGLALAQFGREAFLFDLTASGQFAQAMEDTVRYKKFGALTGYRPTTEAPSLRILAPKPGRPKGPRPKIRVEITRADIYSGDLNLGAPGFVFTLDGLDLKPLMSLRTKMNTDLKPNKPFEQIRLRARPEQPLAQGEHTVTVAINGARTSWTFRVAKSTDDPEDIEEFDPEDD